MEPSPVLFVDLYELTMLDAYRREGMADRPATFSLFVRRLPPTRGYLVAAGLDDALRWLEDLRFGEAELGALERLGGLDDDFLDWLGRLRFTGTVRAVPEGTIVFAHEPVLEVQAPMAEAQVAETFLLNQITLQTMLATKAARCRYAAAGRPLIDFAARRTQGTDAAMKLARISRLIGLAGTSNVAGAVRYGMPASGTVAHSFVQAYPNETDAFRAIARGLGDQTVLLVDTYDVPQGVERAIQVARELRAQGRAIRAIRLDSGDLGALAAHARGRLDGAGFPDIQIFVSGGLDEHEMHTLLEVRRAPIDGFGVGSSLGVSADTPTLDSVYKLVAYDGRPVRKRSSNKATWPGPKQVWRAADWSGDVLSLADEAPPGPDYRPLLDVVMAHGRRTGAGQVSLDDAHHRFEQEWADLPEALKQLCDPAPFRVEPSSMLEQVTRDIDARGETPS